MSARAAGKAVLRILLVCDGNAGNVSHRLDRALLAQARLGLEDPGVEPGSPPSPKAGGRE